MEQEMYFQKSPYHPPQWKIVDLEIPEWKGDRYILYRQILDEDDPPWWSPVTTSKSLLFIISMMTNIKVSLIFFGYREILISESNFHESEIGKLLSQCMVKEFFQEIFQDEILEKIQPELSQIQVEIERITHLGVTRVEREYTRRWSKEDFARVIASKVE